jgi:hypothetical protein
MKRIALGTALAATGLLAFPATSPAFKFGAKLNREPDNSAPPHSCSQDGGPGVTSPCTRVLVSSETGFAGGNLKSPSNGVITKFKVRAGAAGKVRFKLVRLKNVTNNSAQGKARAKSKQFQVQGNGFNAANPIETFNVNIKVKKGDYLAIDSSSTSVLRCTSGSVRQLLWSPRLKIGDPFRTNDGDGSCTLMVQAVAHK